MYIYIYIHIYIYTRMNTLILWVWWYPTYGVSSPLQLPGTLAKGGDPKAGQI